MTEVKLTNSELGRLAMACASIAFSFNGEAKEDTCTEDRKKVCESSSKMWMDLRNKLRAMQEALNEEI